MTRRSSMCLSIDGAIREAESSIRNRKRGPSYANDDAGRPVSWAAFRAWLLIEKSKGREVLPMGEHCGDPCGYADKGCTGFRYSEKGGKHGCPGYEIAAAPEPPR